MVSMKLKVNGIEFDVSDVEQAKKLMELTLVTKTSTSPEWAKEFIAAAYRVFVNLNPDTQRIEKLRAACGYVENGTCGTVVLSQDDATKDWSVVGSNAKCSVWAPSFREAIDELEICYD